MSYAIGSTPHFHFQMIRILANMSINPMVGSSLTCTSPVFCSSYVRQIEIESHNVGNTTEGNKVRRAGLHELMAGAWVKYFQHIYIFIS
jgi:hypothetical protein